jgi:2,5-diamino-6-(ribosylamino)-4(3H)-pyrimidinone 5'-phosphate reductase
MIPHVIIHMGISLDGRIDRGFLPNSPYYDLVSSFHADLDLSGTGTMLAAPVPEDPQTEYGEVYEKWMSMPARPRLAIVDSRGRIRNWHLLKKQAWWSGYLALCSEATPRDHLDYLRDNSIEYIVAGQDRVDLRRALEELNSRYGVNTVRTDCGGILNGVLLRLGLVSEVSAIINPTLVGGTSPRTMFVAPDLESEQGVIQLKLLDMQRLNEQFVWLRYEVCPN